MSKAFTKEGEGPEPEVLPPYHPPWPSGGRNYVTPSGHAALRAEQAELLARVGPSTEARRRLAVLAVHLEAAEVIPPVVGAVDRVQFGTVVVGRAEDGRRRSWAIVGIDEVGAEPDRVSWLSPVARALHGAEVGDTVTIRTPRGEETWEIESIVGLGS